MVLLLLDHNRDRLGPVHLEIEQSLAGGEHIPQLPRGNLEGARVAALSIDDPGHEPVPAQAPGCPAAEDIAGRDLECGSILGHGRLRSGARIENVRSR
jgi:hypothetical protein